MIMNFSSVAIPLPEPYISQDETDILLEIDRIDGTKHQLDDIERRFLNATLRESELL